MKVKINALNKDYLVEFKSEEEFINFSTQHNDKIKNIEIINEDTLPQLEKPVELAKPSKSDGWKALEKSAFTTKEKNVNKKSMDLGGKYKEFKYEPDKTLSSQCDDKVSKPEMDSPALKGEEPKVKDVEATAKENEVEVKDAPKAETSSEDKAEPAKSEQPKSEPSEKKEEDKSEEPKEEKSDDKDDEKKEVKESVEDETLTPEQIEEVKDYFKDLVEDKDNYPDYEAMIQAMRSLDSNGAISHEQYNYCLAHWDEWLSEYDPDNLGPVDEALGDVFKSAGVELNEGIKDYLPRTGFIRTDDEDKDSQKVGAFLGQGTDEQLRKAKIIAKVKFMNGDRMGRVSKEDLEHFDEYKAQYDEMFGGEIEEGADPVGIERNPHKGDDLVSYAKSTTWTPSVEEGADYSEKFGNKSFKEIYQGFKEGKYSYKQLKDFMEQNNIKFNKEFPDPMKNESVEDEEVIEKEDGLYSDDKESRLEDLTSVWLVDGSGSIEIKAPESLVLKVAQSGDNEPAVEELRNAVQDQISKYSDDELKDLIADYGVEDVDSMDRKTLENYTLWTLAWDAAEREPSDDLEEGTKEGFKGEYADTDKEVEADSENKPSEEFKAKLEKHGKLKGDGTDKLDEDTTDVDAQDPDLPSGTVKVKVYDIQWDCDGDDPQECGLPNELELDINHDGDFSLDDEISDELSDSTGYCHYGFKYDVIKGE